MMNRQRADCCLDRTRSSHGMPRNRFGLLTAIRFACEPKTRLIAMVSMGRSAAWQIRASIVHVRHALRSQPAASERPVHRAHVADCVRVRIRGDGYDSQLRPWLNSSA